MSSEQDKNDRVDQLMAYLNDPTMDTLPEHLRFKYTDGWNPDTLEEELQQHPFFMTELPDPSKPLPPLLEAFQQLKYSETENSSHELALNHKEDGLFHFKLKKYRIAATCFSTALTFELKSDQVDKPLVAQLYNNRSASMWYIGNYRSSLQDCVKALEYDPSYFKAVKRGLMCLEKIGKWDELITWCDKWEEVFQEVTEIQVFCDARKRAMVGKSKNLAEERRRDKEEGLKDNQKRAIMQTVIKRGYKLRNEAFLESDAAARENKVVMLDEKGDLHWPVLFMYPQYHQTDFIEAFWEGESFSTHLHEMLDLDTPSWDADREYTSRKVEVWYLGDKFIQVNPDATLHDVMKEECYWIPTNGVPCFFILSKENQFCKDFKERVDIDGLN